MTATSRCAAATSRSGPASDLRDNVTRDAPALHGWLVIDKPVGIGSTPVVGAVKRALRDGGYAKVKVGHGGTLDPLASGVLPVALGEATKLAGRMLDADKEYKFTIAFGAETSTLDLEGEVVATSDVRPTREQVEAALERFRGEIVQVPPAYSALMVDGKRAYDRARTGETVELAGRLVTIHDLSVHLERSRETPPSEAEAPERKDIGNDRQGVSTTLDMNGLGGCGGLNKITLTTRVSKGTYVRSLARDIARALGTVGHVVWLRRTHAGPFTLAPAISLDKLAQLAKAGALEQALLPLTSALDDIPVLPVTPDQASALRQGRTIGIACEPGFVIAMLDAIPVALAEVSDRTVRVVRGFNL